ncbi:MFS transporter [Chloroflexota bacterium]
MKVGRKPFYGWVVAIAGAVVFFAAGNFQYSFGVFVKPLINHFGWSRAAISGSVSIRFIVSGIVSTIAGALSDRYGPKKFILIGIILVGLSYMLTSRITDLWQLYIFLGLLTGLGLTTLYVPVMVAVTKWFGDKSASANGIALTGFSMAQVILPPAATYIIIRYGWSTCFFILALVAWGLGSLAWSFIKTPPNMNNKLQVESGEEFPETAEIPTGAKDQYTLSGALHTRTLWVMILFFMVVAGCYQMVAIHIVAAAIDAGITPESAAFILTLGGITNGLGRLIVGGIASKYGNKSTLIACLVLQALSLLALVSASELYVFYMVISVYGIAYGGVSPIMPALAENFFGTKSIGAIYGSIVFSYTVGAAIGPFLAGYIFDVTGSYSMAFLSATIATGIGFLLCLRLKPPRKRALISA